MDGSCDMWAVAYSGYIELIIPIRSIWLKNNFKTSLNIIVNVLNE